MQRETCQSRYQPAVIMGLIFKVRDVKLAYVNESLAFDQLSSSTIVISSVHFGLRIART
jgi:hypothetical protein